MDKTVFIKKWSRIREKGYLRYILIRCILGCTIGLLGGFLTVFLSYITWNKGVFNSLNMYIGAALVGASIGSISTGISSWKRNEQKYLSNK